MERSPNHSIYLTIRKTCVPSLKEIKMKIEAKELWKVVKTAASNVKAEAEMLTINSGKK